MTNRKYRDRKWNSLNDFKQFLERTKFESIKDFNGIYLRTNHGTYGLFDGQLSFRKK